MKNIHDAKTLQNELNGLSLVGRRILSFDILGRPKYLNHQSMLDTYNNCVVPEGGPYRKPGSVIFENEIPLNLIRTRMVSTDGPYILKLDDGRILEILIPDYSAAAISTSYGKSIERNREFNASMIMSPIVGECISSTAVGKLPEGVYEWNFLEGASDPFKYIRIDCEEHSLYLSYPSCTLMNNVKGLDPLSMTMGELKDSISYYSELFDL